MDAAQEQPAPRNMSPVLAEADNKLYSWASWSRNHADHVGWPKTSVAWRMMEQHRIGVRIDPQHIPLEIPPEVARVDRIVAALPEKLQRVVRAQYFVYGPLEVKARHAKVGAARFKQLLESARWAVHVALEVKF